MSLNDRIDQLVKYHPQVLANLPRARLNRHVIDNGDALLTKFGAMATWTPPESTGRSPADTVFVHRDQSAGDIDWDSPNNHPIEPTTFDMLVEDALETMAGAPKLYESDRTVGADPAWTMAVRTISTHALTAAFADNMFRPMPPDLSPSVFQDKPFTILVCPYHKLSPHRYEGRLRLNPATGKTTDMAVAMDLDRRVGVVYGSAYCGSVKKMVFTVMNYYLPAAEVLPLHCAANEGPKGDTALLLGLSGTGKTTLSHDPRRALLGDDEHGWGEHGIANIEGGCYAKLIDLNKNKEPEIFRAVFHEQDAYEHHCLIENAMMYPSGQFDLADHRLTPNSRASYPLDYLSNIKTPPVGTHPRTILFLTADASGTLPPVARLSREQAMLWFLMGYTSKLAGTETGVVDPQAVFSRFFGEPFMPRLPNVYADMLGARLDRHQSDVYLINTGWSGGPFGEGSRIDIDLTREMVQAALSGDLRDMEYDGDPNFHVQVPRRCPGVPNPTVLSARNTWRDKHAYDERARKLAAQFAAHFDKAYGAKNIDKNVAAQCPGK